MIARHSSRGGTDAGFTLLETLVALALLGLMSLLVFALLKTSGTVWARIDDRSTITGDRLRVQEFLREVITATYPAVVKRPDGSSLVAFRGTAGSLELASVLPQSAAIGGFQRIRIWVAESEGNRRLMLAWRPERNDYHFGAGTGSDNESILIEHVAALALAYYGRLRGQPREAWHNEWRDQAGLPRLVRVGFRGGAGEPSLPDMIAAPRIDVDATCVLDPLTKGCRGR